MTTLPEVPAELTEFWQATDRIERLQQTVSPSRLGLWHSCRLKFFFRHILEIRKAPTSSMHCGSTVHGVLKVWNMSRWRREPLVIERFKLLFDKQWTELQADPRIQWEEGEETAERTSAWRALEYYFTETPIRADDRPEAVEVAVRADLSKRGLPTLVGIIDLVRAGGRIVDFKLVGKTPDPEMVIHTHETQLTAYSVLYRDATGRQESALELHHLVRTRTPKLITTSLPPATQQQLDRLFRQIESYRQGVARRDFVRSPGFACKGCEYFGECRSWSP